MLEKLFKLWTQYRLERLQRKLDAQNKPFSCIEQIVQQLQVSQNEQTKVLQTWMNSFQVHEVPKSTVVRDEDEFTAEQDRAWEELNGSGIPSGVAQSVRNAIQFGAFGEVKDIFDIP